MFITTRSANALTASVDGDAAPTASASATD
jgi:hypothetical protein